MRQPVDAARLREFIHALGREADREGRAYLTVGSSAVLLSWRDRTIDIDLKLEPESDRLLRAIAELKERLDVNLELACPDQFIPELPGWRERSQWIVREGKLDFHHYDIHAQALAKIERGHAQDREDHMLSRGRVDREVLERRFAEIEPLLYRYPAIDGPFFRRAVEAVTRAARAR